METMTKEQAKDAIIRIVNQLQLPQGTSVQQGAALLDLFNRALEVLDKTE
jgi:hypothetical protein